MKLVKGIVKFKLSKNNNNHYSIKNNGLFILISNKIST
jgi:hypothetical protein